MLISEGMMRLQKRNCTVTAGSEALAECRSYLLTDAFQYVPRPEMIS
jgi:hypothetical protein